MLEDDAHPSGRHLVSTSVFGAVHRTIREVVVIFIDGVPRLAAPFDEPDVLGLPGLELERWLTR